MGYNENGEHCHNDGMRALGQLSSAGHNRGNRWLRTALVECAWAASVKKDWFLRFWQLAGGNRKHALILRAYARRTRCVQAAEVLQSVREDPQRMLTGSFTLG